LGKIEICVYVRPHLLSSPPGEEIADDGFEFSNGGSANSDAGHFVRLTMILPLLGEKTGVREDYSTSYPHEIHEQVF
jgi:hypothetical protein